MQAFTSGLPSLAYADLFTLEGLTRLDQDFLNRLKAADPARHAQLLEFRDGKTFTPVETSELLLAGAPLLDDIIGDVFGIRTEVEAARRGTLSHGPVYAFKKQFVARRARRRL